MWHNNANIFIGRVSYIRLCYFCFRWKTVSLVQASMQHLMHHATVSLQQSKITLQNNCINNTSITQPTLSFYFWLVDFATFTQTVMIRTVLLNTGSSPNMSKAGSGINILYLLTGPTTRHAEVLSANYSLKTWRMFSYVGSTFRPRSVGDDEHGMAANSRSEEVVIWDRRGGRYSVAAAACCRHHACARVMAFWGY